jgi:hypothetical protein
MPSFESIGSRLALRIAPVENDFGASLCKREGRLISKAAGRAGNHSELSCL